MDASLIRTVKKHMLVICDKYFSEPIGLIQSHHRDTQNIDLFLVHTNNLGNTFKERHLWLLTIEAFDQSDEKTWPNQYRDNDEDKYKRQRQRQLHLENTFKERSLRLLTFETFDQSDGETWKTTKIQQKKKRQRQGRFQIHLDHLFDH